MCPFSLTSSKIICLSSAFRHFIMIYLGMSFFRFILFEVQVLKSVDLCLSPKLEILKSLFLWVLFWSHLLSLCSLGVGWKEFVSVGCFVISQPLTDSSEYSAVRYFERDCIHVTLVKVSTGDPWTGRLGAPTFGAAQNLPLTSDFPQT